MPELDSLKSRIREILAVGTTLDAMLDDAVRDAIEDFELSIDLPYQRQYISKVITGADRVLQLPAGLKSLRWVRDSERQPIRIVDEWAGVRLGEGRPTLCWLRNARELEFNFGGGEAVEACVFAKTPWKPDDSAPVWEYRRLLLWRALSELGPIARKRELAAEYQAKYDQGMTKLQLEAERLIDGQIASYMGGWQ